jgi:hypothetical protein
MTWRVAADTSDAYVCPVPVRYLIWMPRLIVSDYWRVLVMGREVICVTQVHTRLPRFVAFRGVSWRFEVTSAIYHVSRLNLVDLVCWMYSIRCTRCVFEYCVS